MSITSKLRDIWYQERVKTIIRQSDAKTKPLFDLARGVCGAAFGCAQVLKESISPEQHPDTWIYVCFEFVYFFMHLASRSASAILGNERRAALQDELAPLVAKGVVAGLFDHWPEEHKRGIERDFFQKLNAAELEYAKCRGLLSKEEPFTGNSLISSLARNITELMGQSLDPATMVAVVNAATTELQALNLDALVKAAGR